MVMKLTVLAALLAALIAAASATTYTTVVTTTVADEENPRGQQGCRSEVQQMGFRRCMQYMQRSGGQYGPEPFLRSAVANPRYGEEDLNECCNELSSVRSECRCEALKHMVRQMEQQGQGQQREMEQIRQTVEMLPQRCQMQMPSQCRIRAAFF